MVRTRTDSLGTTSIPLALAWLACIATACAPSEQGTTPTSERPHLPVTDSDGGVKRAVVDVVVDCRAASKPISPDIYGIGYDLTGYSDANDAGQWLMGPSARRFGGNASTRYNWELGTFNHGSDWVFANNSTPKGEPLYAKFLRENDAKGVTSAITIPIIGWVAKDATSASFPLSKYPSQMTPDTARGAGDGKLPNGKPIESPPATDTSVAASPQMEGKWVANLTAAAPNAKRIYILDNEPGLWNSTHRDVHPQPMTYDELLDKTIAYAHEIRVNDPHARIAGPSAYGWPDYFFSGKDAKYGFRVRPDRRMHGDMPLLAYYLRELHAHEVKTGERLLDLLDVHYYPQSEDIGIGVKGGVDARTAAVRVRSPRALWDPSYPDESWIKEPVRLLPRLREWIDQYYPGVGIQIGEWNYGAEEDMSGGLATAETLGRFADNGVASAFYWTFPPPQSPAAFAFRAFRNFDGYGGRFLDSLVPVDIGGTGASVWVSRDASGKHLVLVVLDFMPEAGLDTRIHVDSCGTSPIATSYVYAKGSTAFAASTVLPEKGVLRTELPAYSITTIDIRLK